LTCGSEDITLLCGEETGLGITEKTFRQSVLGIGFTKKESNDHAIIYERFDGKFDPDDATKLGQLSYETAKSTRGKDTGKQSWFSDENVVTIVRDIWAHRTEIKNLSSFYGIEANLARLELSGRDAKSVFNKLRNTFDTTVVSKLLVDPVFLNIVKYGVSAIPKKEDKRKAKAKKANASTASTDTADIAEAVVHKKKRKTELPASSGKENEENLKPASDKKPASESPKKKSALEDSMNLSDYSSDQDEAESPKKTDWDQLEMNSDEESYNSCDEDSSSDEAALPWTDKDDDEWKP
ncbi:hypothetical protein ACHAWC_001200, partial [Mediolabrus comicus]